MELVARELKAMGVYTARALSYAGVEYDILEHELTPGQIRDFDTYADAWAIIHRNMEEALAAASVVDRDRKSVVSGKSVPVRVDLGGGRNQKKKKKKKNKSRKK